MTTSPVLVPCKLCKNKVQVSDLRRNKEGVYVCSNCLNYGYYGTPALREVSPTRRPLEISKPTTIKKEEKVAYLCSSCKYSFTKPLGSEDKNCPLCGRDYSVQRKQDAAELLRSVDEMFGE